MMMKLFYIVHIVFFLLLATMSYIQLNDPDPAYWVGFYGLCAIVPALTIFKHNNRYFNWACILFCFLTLAMTISGTYEYLGHMANESLTQDMSPEKPYIEEAREFIGTLIALAIMAFYQWLAYRKQSLL